jgi:hypothetical protein
VFKDKYPENKIPIEYNGVVSLVPIGNRLENNIPIEHCEEVCKKSIDAHLNKKIFCLIACFFDFF